MVSDKIFQEFHYVSKTSDPRIGAISDHRAIIWTVLVEDH